MCIVSGISKISNWRYFDHTFSRISVTLEKYDKSPKNGEMGMSRGGHNDSLKLCTFSFGKTIKHKENH